ncbi:MAG: hypothetical protein HY564_01465 [Candidatus Jacksonbacteria bacterium]|nr:hypothetical protein [Candidatus Jacksonbacteria bacterium]
MKSVSSTKFFYSFRRAQSSLPALLLFVVLGVALFFTLAPVAAWGHISCINASDTLQFHQQT